MARPSLAAGGHSPGRQTLKPARETGWQGQPGRGVLSGGFPGEGFWQPQEGPLGGAEQPQEGPL
ncbi:MAG: hypothetical protein HFI63_04320 [Lachnospiraceae bacterium]|nr:hypothetical protein [Lachnospiraceae bacterium]